MSDVKKEILLGDCLDLMRGIPNGSIDMILADLPYGTTTAKWDCIIPKMQSLPQSAKDLILKSKGFVDYTSQCLIYNENNGRADSWVPSISDVFAEDWEIVK